MELHVIVQYFLNRRPVSSIGKGEVCRARGRRLNPRPDQHSRSSLLGGRLEVVGAKKNGAREGDTRGEREPPVSLSRAQVFFSRPNASKHLLSRLLKILKWRMCCLCCAIYKWLNILVFPDKEEKPQSPSHSCFTVLILVGRKRTNTAVRKEQGAQTPVVWYNLLWAGWVMKGLISFILFHPLSPC